ncbi:MAG: ferrous iron transport protein A [Caldisericaceae bacterium]|nr:ferrous iron transport protein A [Caldisericaceae bacterium]
MIRNNVTLLDIKAGEKAEIVSLAGGYGFMRRLQEMGLIPGQIVEVVRNSAMGPVEISVMGTHLAIGRGIAAKVIVRPVRRQIYGR